jgi:transposase InsO family protein
MNDQSSRDRAHDHDAQQSEKVALFRYGLIADLTHLEPGARGMYELLRKKAEATYDIPESNRCRVAAETLRGWLKAYRTGGFDALIPKTRSDAGTARALAPEIADLLLTIKEERPNLTVPLVISEARRTGKLPEEVKIAHSTLSRLFSRHGFGRKDCASRADGKDRRRFAFECAGELWMSDVMHGPAVLVEGRKKRKAYLIAFIDDATRVVPYAAFALSENTAAYLSVLEQAIIRRGIPKRLYVDNGAAFRSRHLALVCAKLNIALIHAKPYDAAAKGKIERWFRTVRMQLLPILTEADTSSLDALNRRLWAWVEGEYHRNPHRGLNGDTPIDRWASTGASVRYPDPTVDLADLFCCEVRRAVHKDRTISLDGVIYEVEPHLVGTTVLLRYHPGCSGKPVQVWDAGKRCADATVVNAYANCFVRRGSYRDTLEPAAAPATPPAGLSLRNLRAAPETKGVR